MIPFPRRSQRFQEAAGIAFLLVLFTAVALGADYDVAVPGYRYLFPRDHFGHPNYRTEWWYYTGNLKTARGHRFGFELTFFRQAVARPLHRTSPWQVDDLYLAHLALSDLDGRRFYYAERLNRAGPGLAGFDLQAERIWNGNWQVSWQQDTQDLQAITEKFTLLLSLSSGKLPVINGEDGVSQKAPGPGHASHYISLTRLVTTGEVEFERKKHKVQGTAWMDHEFFTHQLKPEQIGWDWLSLQLDNGSELMLYRLRRKDGTLDPFSAGTYVNAQGISRHLRADDFLLEPGETWTSPTSGARYPIHWKIVVPSLAAELDARTPLESQELVSRGRLSPTYWEGAMMLQGSMAGSPTTGVGYLEMTGYDRAVDLSR